MQHTIWLFAYHTLFLELTNVTLYRNAISTPTFEGDGEIISLQAINRLKKLGLSLEMLTNLSSRQHGPTALRYGARYTIRSVPREPIFEKITR